MAGSPLMQWMTNDPISNDGIMWEFLYLSAFCNHLTMFCDGLSSKVPYCARKLILCFSTVICVAPAAAACPCYNIQVRLDAINNNYKDAK